MKLVQSALHEKNLKLAQLSPELQAKHEELRKMMFDYNIACENFEDLPEEEQDEETAKKLDDMQVNLKSMEKVLSDEILAFTFVEPQPNPPVPTPTPEPVPTPTPESKKEDNSLGWFIFAGVAAVVTFGAVNMFKKRG